MPPPELLSCDRAIAIYRVKWKYARGLFGYGPQAAANFTRISIAPGVTGIVSRGGGIASAAPGRNTFVRRLRKFRLDHHPPGGVGGAKIQRPGLSNSLVGNFPLSIPLQSPSALSIKLRHEIFSKKKRIKSRESVKRAFPSALIKKKVNPRDPRDTCCTHQRGSARVKKDPRYSLRLAAPF